MLNHTVLIGRIGQTPELKTTPNGTEVVSFNLAVQRNYNKEITDWISIVAWKGTASLIAKHFNKGDMICIEGNIQTRNYDDKDGKKVYITEVIAERVHFVGEKQKEKSETNTQPAQSNSTSFNNDDFIPVGDDDNLPF